MDYSPENLDLEKEIKCMSERVKILRVKTFIVNTYKHWNSFDGAWVFDKDGKRIAQSLKDEILSYEEVSRDGDSKICNR